MPTKTKPVFVTVAISGPLRRTFTYQTDEITLSQLRPGQTVSVPFGKRRMQGFYLGPADKPKFQTKKLGGIVGSPPPFDNRRFSFYQWLADYYFCNPADVLSLTLPPRARGGAKTRVFLRRDAETTSHYSLASLPDRILKRLQSGAHLRATDIKEIETVTLSGLNGLLQDGILEERVQWAEASQGRMTGYTVAIAEQVVEEIQQCNEQEKVTLSDGVITRERLREYGLTDHRLRKLTRAGALRPAFADSLEDYLKRLPYKASARDLVPNVEQSEAIDSVAKSLGAGFKVSLLYGVTGSGKTLVYAELIKRTRARGLNALFLAPEIALAGETLGFLRGAITEEIGLWHSALSASERSKLWEKLAKDQIHILVGARSALFAPLQNLGIIIVDEEHDDSFKQENPAPRFHARDAAIRLGQILNIPVLLGSGTPSLESFHNATNGKYTLLELKSRPTGQAQPKIETIDMRSDRLGGAHGFVSLTLKQRVQETLDKGKQAILYLNRRGFAPRLRCRSCGEVASCPDCHCALTLHKSGSKKIQRLICHFCGFTRNTTDKCPSCKSDDILFTGTGTQKVEEEIIKLFERCNAARLDTDAASSRTTAWKILEDFSAGKQNLLIGTQMIAKGLDIPGVALVGALAPENEINMVDFRADEKAFARLTQVAGRSGRARERGLALIQTFKPDSELLKTVIEGDYRNFFQEEIVARKKVNFPPFCRVARIVISAAKETELEKVSIQFAEQLRTRLQSAKLNARIMGPVPCQMHRLRALYRMHIQIFTNNMTRLSQLLTEWEAEKSRFGIPAKVRVTVDIDATDFL